jgi:hypothetical protein
MVLILIQLRALVVQLDLAKVMEDKLRAFHAFPVNSMMLPVRLLASFAQQTPFQAIKIGPCPVTTAPLARHRSQEVSRATELRVNRALMKIALMANAKTAHKAGNQNNWMQRNALTVTKAPQRMVVEVRSA